MPSAPSGVYNVRYLVERSPFTPYTNSYIEARCDMETDGGGWLVIQRRLPNGTVNFTRDWSDYENGFGDLNGEFWYGLRNIHALTSRDDVELRIDMVMEDDGSELSWTYQTFRVACDTEKYRLTIGDGVGLGADAMRVHNDSQFSTYDSDNDKSPTNCAFVNQGGWWYGYCHNANLNGPHTAPSLPGVDSTHATLEWLSREWEHLSSAEMKIRIKTKSV